jgi:hypothetical protein
MDLVYSYTQTMVHYFYHYVPGINLQFELQTFQGHLIRPPNTPQQHCTHGQYLDQLIVPGIYPMVHMHGP